jgi:hypothetical protein
LCGYAIGCKHNYVQVVYYCGLWLPGYKRHEPTQ